MSKGLNKRIRVIIAGPSGIVRDSVRALLQSVADIEVIAGHESIEDCVADIGQLSPDLLITEQTLAGGGSGLELISRAVARLPRLGCVVLAQGVGGHCTREAMSAGARGYVSTRVGKSELLTALRIVHAGERYLCRVSTSRVLSEYLVETEKAMGKGPLDGITPREREVLLRVALGTSNKAIAREMGVSPKTVEKHRANFMRKLSLRGRTGATVFAMTHGLAGHDMTTRSSR